MRKLIALFIISLLVLFAVGCSKEEKTDRKLTSRPVQVKSTDQPAATEPISSDVPAKTVVEESSNPVPVGAADCAQLSSTDVAAVLGGTWSKTSDCPQRPAMPEGVSVCMCSYDGPKQVYVNVETQLYDSTDEAERVYNMYCSNSGQASEVGTRSCRVEKKSDVRPNFVYFLSGNYFVKVSCLGGSCPLDAVAALAKKVEEKI